jgi:hypothetical protein
MHVDDPERPHLPHRRSPPAGASSGDEVRLAGSAALLPLAFVFSPVQMAIVAEAIVPRERRAAIPL